MLEIKPNFLFIVPNFFYIEEYQKLLYHNNLPLGTLQLSSFLKKHLNVNAQIIDMRLESERFPDLEVNKESNEEKTRKQIIKILEVNNIQDFPLIGLNCYTSYQYLSSKLIATVIKELFPQKKVVVGGYHPTAVPEDFSYLKSPFDFVIQGEAEVAVLNLIKSKYTKPTNSESKPIVICSEKVLENNDLPFPDYELYLKKYPFKNKFKFDFYSSRGCPFQCAFCATNYKFRSFTFESFKQNFDKLVSIVENFNEKNPKISFADQEFTSVSISEKILDYILKNNLQKSFSFSCQSRVESLNLKSNIIEKYKAARMVVGFGFESANKHLLKEMHKTANPTKFIEDMKKILKKYKELNDIYCRVNLLIGFPGENQNNFDETIQFVNTYAMHNNVQISPSLFSNYPNVHVYRNMAYYEKKFGSKFVKEWWKLHSNQFKSAVPIQSSKNYSIKDLLGNYLEKYLPILKTSKLNSLGDLIVWKQFYGKWFQDLQN